ncbi:hypothetical protein [Nocardioides sp. CER19]|uniref:hypothetical protein n=1 Tax=Nocardioides sp. CER19 TaxID=3038538 RepID=UPI00244823F4|nr:hypothetical protein [Nocardioides sp. CER19]MDH2413949.1 hypothetical protein [Nocardioides sp. CER19]
MFERPRNWMRAFRGERYDLYRAAIADRADPTRDETPDPWAKFLWAYHRMDRLYGDVDRWVKAGNLWVETTAGDISGNDVRTDHWLRLNSIPADWAPRSGEVFQHYRSSLDHLIFALSTFVKGEPLTEAEALACEYPVVDPGRELAKNIEERRLRWLPKEAREYIRDQQPIFFGKEKNNLWLLHRFANIDKHRSLNVTGVGALAPGGHIGDAGDLFDGEALLAAPGLDGKPCLENCHMYVSVSVGDGVSVKTVPLIRAMCQVHVHVEEILHSVIDLTVPGEFEIGPLGHD